MALWGGCFEVTELSVAACSVAACHACKNVCEVKTPESCGRVPKKGSSLARSCNDRAARRLPSANSSDERRPGAKSPGLSDSWAVNKLAWRRRVNTCVGGKELIRASSLISLNLPRLQLARNLNLPGKLINPYNFQGSLVKTCTHMAVTRRWRRSAMEMLTLPATQEYLVSKMAFSTRRLVPLFEFLTPTTYSKQAVENEAHWKSLMFYPCRFTPSFYNVTWQALHDEGLMIYFLSWDVGIAPRTQNSVESQ